MKGSSAQFHILTAALTQRELLNNPVLSAGSPLFVLTHTHARPHTHSDLLDCMYVIMAVRVYTLQEFVQLLWGFCVNVSLIIFFFS